MARKNKKKKTLAFKNAVAGYLFIAPFIIGFILFLVVPLVQSLSCLLYTSDAADEL